MADFKNFFIIILKEIFIPLSTKFKIQGKKNVLQNSYRTAEAFMKEKQEDGIWREKKVNEEKN